MNINKTFAAIVIVALLLAACAPAPPAPPTPGATSLPLLRSVGIISAQEKLVESGPGDNLAQVTNTADFFDSDTVRVTNGGVAKLDLSTGQIDNLISILIFNDTAVDNVNVDPAETTDPIVTLLLVFGGLTGEVPKNGGVPVQFTTPNGVNIFILGTQFLVAYDPETSTTYIGNFDGTIAYSMPPGQSVQFTQPGQLYEISSSFEIKQSTMNFTRADIENRTSSTRSRLLDTLEGYSTPTATPTPTTTPTPAFTPTITPTPTQIIPCNKAAFVADVTIPDGTSFSPGFQFTKVWRLRNVGTCTWTTSYSLVFYRGEQMGGLTSISIPSTVAPGQTVDVAVNFVAPQFSGTYRGDWMLQSPFGALFGAGANGTTPIWVNINVIGLPDLTVSIGSGPTVTCDPNIVRSCSIITTIGFVITNTSQTDVTSTFQVLIEAIGLQSVTLTVNELTAGSSQNFIQTFRGGCFNPDCTARVTVDSGNAILEANETNNTVENTIRAGTIKGTVLGADTNNDGKPDPVQGFTVTLWNGTHMNPPIASETTDAYGVYKFTDLSAGSYIVEWIGGCSPSNANPTPVMLNAGETKIVPINTNIIC